MSTQKHIIEIEPPTYQQVRETMEFWNYRCPVCNGMGGFTEQVGHDESKTIPCDYCDGTGKVKATLEIKWRPDYD